MKMRNVFIVRIVILLLAFDSAVCAQERYQAEIAGAYNRIDVQENFNLFSPSIAVLQDNRTISYGMSGQVFFMPVNTAGHLRAESAFLERKGSVLIRAEHLDVKEGKDDGDGTRLFFLVNYASPGFPLAIGASFQESQIRLPRYGQELKGDKAALSIAGYFTDSLLAGIDLAYNYVNTYSMFAYDFLFFSDETVDYGLFGKYVSESDSGRGMVLEGRIGATGSIHGDQSTSITESFSLAYYWNRDLSTGIGFQNSSGPIIRQGQTYSANARYFMTPRLSVSAAYARFAASDHGDPYGDAESVNATLAVRF